MLKARLGLMGLNPSRCRPIADWWTTKHQNTGSLSTVRQKHYSAQPAVNLPIKGTINKSKPSANESFASGDPAIIKITVDHSGKAFPKALRTQGIEYFD